MTSKEALEELKIYLPAIYSEVAKCLNTIKQDLERLELTEALYNNTLKEMKTIKDDDRKLYLKFKDLEKENQELKSKYNDLMLDFKMFDFNTLKQENKKLKKAIEIVKSKNVDIFFLVNNCEFVLDNYNYEIEDDIMKYCYKDCSTLTQQECDLLKEVLE